MPTIIIIKVCINTTRSLQFSQSCPTLCDPMNRSFPGLPVHHQLLEFTQTHVHWPCPPPGDLPNPGIEPTSPSSPALAGGFLTTSATWEAPIMMDICH